MSEFFLELFSEEIPATLQSAARNKLLENFKNFFEKEKIVYKNEANSYSTPNRLVIHFKNLSNEIIQKSEEIRGPNINAPEKALEGFLKSNQIEKKNIFKKKTEKGEFYFYKKPERKIRTEELLNSSLPNILDNIPWKKSMKWGDYSMFWGRPLKSILAIFNGKPLNFKYHHLTCSNVTYIDKDFEEKLIRFKDFKSYISYFKNRGIIINNNFRRKFIEKELIKNSSKKNLKVYINEKLLSEVTDIVEKPKVILCSFDKKFLEIPKEILVVTMQKHQKYFPTFDKKENLTNNFFIISDIKDQKGFVRIGNERVVEARLNDADFFWKKNKSQNLVKRVSMLKNMNYFKGLGTYFDKVQRIRKLSGLISDELLISKEKIEIASTICKVDLLSDLVSEFPELQGILGGHFAQAQGFDKDICLAISEHYLPTGPESKIPKKPYSLALSLSDKIDSLVGFFGINLKPTSSKDPYALRRSTIGLIRMILENNKELKIKDLINYSSLIYNEQNLKFDSKKINQELSAFFVERLKNFMKEKDIRADIIESTTSFYGIDNLLKIYKKALTLNKLIKNEIGTDVISGYKRAHNILNAELNNKEMEISGSADPGLFKNDFEKNLYKKINDIRKYYVNYGNEENYEGMLKILASAKKEISEFFENVIVNDEDLTLKKNRLELLQMLCKTFNNYCNFSKVESIT